MGNKEYSFELKYIIPNSRASHILIWLKTNCIPDPEFAEATVSSIYYDDRQWTFLREKINSDYLKTKIRLRWYSDISYIYHYETSFMEAKFKIGGRRHKIRTKTSYTGEWISAQNLENAALMEMPYLLQDKGYYPQKQLFPAFQISYKRSRFIEPFTRSRICFDYDIRAPRINYLMMPKSNPAVLQKAVFEIKGKEEELPVTLYPLTDLGCKISSFSKYSVCYQQLLQMHF
ncbi:MAG: VTC domain-containing protein [Spirochaetes bacterium]|nr:VTC domain-containing protein [Spirochaetota bacterium]